MSAVDEARKLGERPLTDKIDMLTREDAPAFDTFEELGAFLDGVKSGATDYGRAGSAMAYAATSAFNTMARQIGASGFQASIAGLMAYGSIAGIRSPFGVVKAEDMMFPHSESPAESAIDMEAGWREWAKEEAQKKIAEYDAKGWTGESPKLDENGDEIPGEIETYDMVHPDVKAHWEELAAWEPEEIIPSSKEE